MIITLIILLAFPANAGGDTVVRKAIYFPVEGTDIEHGQGAIERIEVSHCEVERNVWFVRLPAPGSCEDWQRRLNEVVGAPYGRFEVKELTESEQGRVDRGEIRFQQ